MSFQCARCKNPKLIEKKNTVLHQGVEFEQVGKFCYLGDMLQNGGGADAAVRTRVSCAWAKFRELCPILTVRGTSLRMKGKIYGACVRSVMVYGSETWPIKVENKLGCRELRI